MARTGVIPDSIREEERAVRLYHRSLSAVKTEPIERSRFNYAGAIHETSCGIEVTVERSESVVEAPLATGATYFPGLQQVPDPARNGVTTLQGLQSQFSNRAIMDAQGNLILVNSVPGQLGTLGQRWIEGPSHVGLDVNLLKRVRITESKVFEVRVDVVNILNTPRWNDPITDINSPNFGRMTAADPTASFQQSDTTTAARRFTINARLNF